MGAKTHNKNSHRQGNVPGYGFSCDRDILELISLMNQLGIHTLRSCQDHNGGRGTVHRVLVTVFAEDLLTFLDIIDQRGGDDHADGLYSLQLKDRRLRRRTGGWLAGLPETTTAGITPSISAAPPAGSTRPWSVSAFPTPTSARSWTGSAPNSPTRRPTLCLVRPPGGSDGRRQPHPGHHLESWRSGIVARTIATAIVGLREEESDVDV